MVGAALLDMVFFKNPKFGFPSTIRGSFILVYREKLNTTMSPSSTALADLVRALGVGDDGLSSDQKHGFASGRSPVRIPRV